MITPAFRMNIIKAVKAIIPADQLRNTSGLDEPKLFRGFCEELPNAYNSPQYFAWTISLINKLDASKPNVPTVQECVYAFFHPTAFITEKSMISTFQTNLRDGYWDKDPDGRTLARICFGLCMSVEDTNEVLLSYGMKTISWHRPEDLLFRYALKKRWSSQTFDDAIMLLKALEDTADASQPHPAFPPLPGTVCVNSAQMTLNNMAGFNRLLSASYQDVRAIVADLRQLSDRTIQSYSGAPRRELFRIARGLHGDLDLTEVYADGLGSCNKSRAQSAAYMLQEAAAFFPCPTPSSEKDALDFMTGMYKLYDCVLSGKPMTVASEQAELLGRLIYRSLSQNLQRAYRVPAAANASIDIARILNDLQSMHRISPVHVMQLTPAQRGLRRGFWHALLLSSPREIWNSFCADVTRMLSLQGWTIWDMNPSGETRQAILTDLRDIAGPPYRQPLSDLLRDLRHPGGIPPLTNQQALAEKEAYRKARQLPFSFISSKFRKMIVSMLSGFPQEIPLRHLAAMLECIASLSRDKLNMWAFQALSHLFQEALERLGFEQDQKERYEALWTRLTLEEREHLLLDVLARQTLSPRLPGDEMTQIFKVSGKNDRCSEPSRALLMLFALYAYHEGPDVQLSSIDSDAYQRLFDPELCRKSIQASLNRAWSQNNESEAQLDKLVFIQLIPDACKTARQALSQDASLIKRPPSELWQASLVKAALAHRKACRDQELIQLEKLAGSSAFLEYGGENVLFDVRLTAAAWHYWRKH